MDGTRTSAVNAAHRRPSWARRIAARYVPTDIVDRYVERNSTDGELVVRVVARSVVARAAMAA